MILWIYDSTALNLIAGCNNFDFAETLLGNFW